MRLNQIRLTLVQFIALVLLGISLHSPSQAQSYQSLDELVRQFENTQVFWKQLEVAKQLVSRGDARVLSALTPWLSNEDRHLRCNAALVFAGLGDERGWQVISDVLKDKSDRPQGQGMAIGRWSVRRQITADRYYAVHMLGELKDKQAIALLVPLLHDEEVNYKAAWALGEIGDERAVGALIGALRDRSSNVRVSAISALEKLGAKEALPDLRALEDDRERTSFGEQIFVGDAAKRAIATLEAKR